MNYIEQPTFFPPEGETLLGILTQPQTPGETGVVIVVGGPQYRVGSHRQFVLLARKLAAAGYPALRFDYRGMGDSVGEARDFQAVSADIAAAIDALQKSQPSVRQIILWGLCDGASAALLYCHETNDRRVSGLCLLNPWVRSEASLARTQVKHYYVQRLAQKEFWGKLLSGKVAWKALAALARTMKTALFAKLPTAATHPYQDRMASAWKSFDGALLLLLSGNDYTAREFMTLTASSASWHGAHQHARLTSCHLPGADHTLSNPVSQALAHRVVQEWLLKLA